MAAKAAPQPPMPHTQGPRLRRTQAGREGIKTCRAGTKGAPPVPALLQGGERVAGRAQQAGRVA